MNYLCSSNTRRPVNGGRPNGRLAGRRHQLAPAWSDSLLEASSQGDILALKRYESGQVIREDRSCAGCRNRTRDLRFTKPLLYHLS